MGNRAVLVLVLALTAASFMVIAEAALSCEKTVENSWSTMRPLPQTGGGLRAAVVNGKVHAIGGSIHCVYDPAENNWMSGKPMPTGRQYFAIAVISIVAVAAVGTGLLVHLKKRCGGRNP